MSKTVLITGASSGFGEATAYRFAETGAKLVLCARSKDKLDALQQELAMQTSVHIATVDLTSQQSVDAFFASLPEQFREIDVLVNNAGLALGMEPAHLAKLEDWETMIDTNIKGLVRMSKAVLTGMVERNSGHIINIGSTAGNWPYPGGNTYGGTKAFVQSFSRALRADLLGKKIRVSNIEPGMSQTNFSNVRFKGDETKAAKVYEGTKPLSAQDVAEMIFWVNSMPEHVNINTLEAMPVCQAWSALSVNREIEY
ncbi:MAG: SDR family oxidoreductase [Pseudohongiellaceae bacterium]|nr:SDR family oxidoreductase [Pseudohongiellaceae bacterium]